MVHALLEQSPWGYFGLHLKGTSATKVTKVSPISKDRFEKCVTRSPQSALRQPLPAAPWATSAMLSGQLEQELLYHRTSLFQNGQPHSVLGSWDKNLGGRAPPGHSVSCHQAENANFHSLSLWAPWGIPSNSSPIMLPSEDPQMRLYMSWGTSIRALAVGEPHQL